MRSGLAPLAEMSFLKERLVERVDCSTCVVCYLGCFFLFSCERAVKRFEKKKKMVLRGSKESERASERAAARALFFFCSFEGGLKV